IRGDDESGPWKRARQLAQLVFRASREGQTGAFRRKTLGEASANAAGGAGEKNPSVVEIAPHACPGKSVERRERERAGTVLSNPPNFMRGQGADEGINLQTRDRNRDLACVHHLQTAGS